MLRSMIVVALLSSAAFAQQPKEPPKKPPPTPPTHNIGELEIAAKDRKIMLITFLERASEELERASLKKRSFIPELLKTVEAEKL